MDYQSQVGISKKTTKELSQRVRQVEIALASVEWQLGQAEQKKQQLSEAIQKAVTKYGSSIDHCELKTADEMLVTVQSLSLLMENTTTAGTTTSPVTTLKKRAKRKAPPPPPTPIDSTTSPNTNQTIQTEEEFPLPSTGSDVEAEHLTADNSSNILKISDQQKQPQYDDLVPQQTTPLPPIPKNWQVKTTTPPEKISPTLNENEENTAHSSVLNELLAKSVHLKSTTKKIPRPARPPNGKAAAMLEASDPIQEAIFSMLCEFTEENEDEAGEIFNDNDSGFGDLSITIPEAKKEPS